MTPEEEAVEFLLFLNSHHHKYYADEINYNIDPEWEQYGLYDEYISYMR